MEAISLVGPYPDEVLGLIEDKMKDYFHIRSIKNQDELDSLIDLEFVILRTLKINGELIKRNPNLKFIQRWGVGYDSVDINTAGRNSIPVAIATGVNSCAVAEHALLLILATYRNLIQLNNNTKNGIWDRKTYSQRSFTISGKKVGLIGCGAIGRLLANKVMALGAEVQYYDIVRLNPEIERTLNIEFVGFNTLISSSDIISIHLPLTDETKNMIGTDEINRMKSNAVIINTSRGGIIDEDALAMALKSNRILGAALDSFEIEPYPKDGILCSLENIIMTPHIGGTVVDLTLPMVDRVCDNIMRVYNNQPLPKLDFVNSQFFKYPIE